MLYLDSNIFIFPAIYDPAKFLEALRAGDKLREVANGETEACTSVLTWDEVVWVVRRLHGPAAASLQGRTLLRMPNIKFLPTDVEVISGAQELLEKYGLKPRDSVHAATALKAGAREFVSFDEDFDSVPSLVRKEP